MPVGFVRSLLLLTLTACLLGIAAPVGAQIAVSEAAHQQFVFAYRLLQRGDAKLAIEAFDDYLGKFPRDEKRGDALYFRALLAKQQGEILQAQKLLDEAAPTPTLVPVSALLLLRGEVAANLQQYKKALESLEKIDPATLEPALRASAFFLRGQALRGTHNLPAAIAQFTAAAQIDSPLRPRAQLELARVQAQTGNLKQAIAAAHLAATSGDPQVSPDAARAAGDFAYQDGQYAQAADYYKIVLTNYSTSSQVSPSALGMMWTMLGMKQYPQIITAFEQYKTLLTPDDRVVAWYLTGSAYQEQGQHDKAAGMFNALVLGSTGSPVEDKAMYKLAYSQAELGQYDQALQTTARLREKHPDSPLVVDSEFLLASVDVKRGNPAGAIKRVTGVIDQGPANPYQAQALMLRAKFLENTQQLDAAAKDYAAFLVAAAAPVPGRVITPASIHEASLRLIDIEYRQGRFESSIKAASALLERDDLPTATRQQALYRQSLAMIRLKDYACAQAALTTLIAQSPPSPYQAEAYYYRGLVGMALKKPDLAVKDLLAAAALPELTDALEINALRLVSIRQREARQTQPAFDTILQLEKLAGLGGLSAGELLWIGQEEIQRKDAAAALKYLKPIVSRQVDSATDQRALATRLTAQGQRLLNDLPAAVATYRQAIALGQSEEGQTRLELAATLAQMNQTAAAIDEYRGLINSEQSAVAAAALDQIATIQLAQARTSAQSNDDAGSKQALEKARKLLKRLVLLYPFPELSPLPQNSYVRLADIELELKNPQGAKSELTDLAEKYPDTAYAQYAKATLLMIDQLKPGDALFLFKKLAQEKLDPELDAHVQAKIKALESHP